jgi:putative ABC transport system ATP-binding protein
MSSSVDAQDLGFHWPAVGGAAAFALHLPAWQVESGARWAVSGPSGCGKSTLLALLAGIVPPATGRLTVEGLDLNTASEAQRRVHRLRHIGQVFQDSPLVASLSVVENVLLPFRLDPALPLDSMARQRAHALLVDLGIADRAHAAPATLSVGERQRVALARALCPQPRLLLADEPTASLDPSRARTAVDLLLRACDDAGATLILVTHDAAVLARFDHVLDARDLVVAR